MRDYHSVRGASRYRRHDAGDEVSGTTGNLGLVSFCVVGYPKEEIERIAELGRDPGNWRPADLEAWELGRRMADAIADGYTDEDWRRVLNSLSPSRAARDIACRPPEEHQRLLMLVDSHRRGEVERLLAALAA